MACLSRERVRLSARSRFLTGVLDKGIVIDACVRVALMGIDLITVQARVVVASIPIYLVSSEALALAGSGSPIEARRTRDEHVGEGTIAGFSRGEV